MNVAGAKTAGQALAIALSQGAQRLSDIPGIDHAREARLLLAHAADLPHDRLHDLALDDFTPDLMDRYSALLARRAARAPMSHILGRRMFWGRNFAVTPDVLDPRPETETLIEAALSVPYRKVLDLGVGSGAILLTLLIENALAKGLGTDVSGAAIAVAQRNADALEVGARARFRTTHWFDGIEERFDLIVSNPPYIAAEEMAGLAPELAHEPRIALTDEADGLSAYREVVSGAPAHLEEGGRLMVEIGAAQGHAVAQLFTDAGFRGTRILRDMDGRDRVVTGRMRPIHRPFPKD